MDDTILLWEIPAPKVWESAINRYTAELGGVDPQVVLKVIRAAADWYWSDPSRHRTGRLDLPAARREIGRMAFEKLGRKDFELADKIADTYNAEREKGGTLAPGAIETLKNLRKRGIKLAMITNGASDFQRAKIEKFNLAPLFDNILIEGEFICGKPDERVFTHTLEKLKVSPSAAWMVGDNPDFDIAPCRSLGIYSLMVDGKSDDGFNPHKIRPDKTIHNISEIPDLLDQAQTR